jgi:hypothetical protein
MHAFDPKCLGRIRVNFAALCLPIQKRDVLSHVVEAAA